MKGPSVGDVTSGEIKIHRCQATDTVVTKPGKWQNFAANRQKCQKTGRARTAANGSLANADRPGGRDE